MPLKPIMKFYLYLLISCFFIVSCSSPTIDSVGGTIINIESTQQINERDAKTVVSRLKAISEYDDYIDYSIEKNKISINGIGIADTTSARQLIERSRMLKVVYAIPPSSYEPIRAFLGEYISSPIKEKPYKSSSLIGLVSQADLPKIKEYLNSPEFKSQFPEAGQFNFGVKLMEGKKALFIQDSSSPFMDESMFEQIGAYEDPDTGEGNLSLKLLESYADRIGKLTGNDSTYLLHLFHDEVYISKIIKPHITSPAFGMAGAFTTEDVIVLSTLWNSNELEQDLTIKSMQLIQK